MKRHESAIAQLLQPLPEAARHILHQYDVPPRLLAHLRLVHDVAIHLCAELTKPPFCVAFDHDAVRFGAATHDIGKLVIPAELSGPGSRHEAQGRALLLACGVAPASARFAQTHGIWRTDPSPSLEDLLVALADTCWKGQRDAVLEQRIATLLTQDDQSNGWEIWLALDTLIETIAADAEQRLRWHARFPCM